MTTLEVAQRFQREARLLWTACHSMSQALAEATDHIDDADVAERVMGHAMRAMKILQEVREERADVE